ncbi:hypothetical protein RZU89_00225 [Campylobacter coli]
MKNLYKEKNDKIDELLPGATSKGLAEAYKDEKEDMQENIKKWNGIFIGSIVLFITLFVIYFIISLNKDFTFASFFRAFPFLFLVDFLLIILQNKLQSIKE